MTIAEAVDDFEQWKGIDARKYCSAAIVLADEYLRLTDPTPLTREVIEKELGPAHSVGIHWSKWSVGEVWLYFVEGTIEVNGIPLVKNATLGDLRWLVAKLRGGAA